MKSRFGIVVITVGLLAAGCSGRSSKGGSNELGPATIPTGQNALCKASLTSPDIGVSDKTITITVAADVQNIARPGLFRGSWDGVKAWGDYMNSKGGLACRQVVVKTADTHLSGDAAKDRHHRGLRQLARDCRHHRVVPLAHPANEPL